MGWPQGGGLSSDLLYGMKGIVTSTLAIACLNMFAGEFHPFDGPKPVAVLVQTAPWAMVIGADNPRVVVYEDGTLIYLRKSKDDAKYFLKKFAEPELSEFKKHLSPVLGLKGLHHFYSLRPNVTDQPETMFYVNDGENELVMRVYGLTTQVTSLPYMVLPGGHKSDGGAWGVA